MDTMNTDTPETDGAERDEARKWSAMLADAGDEIRAQLREEQRLHVQTLNERDEARQWESQALVARIQRDQFSKTLGEVREILCAALPNENQLTSFMAVKLVKERDEARQWESQAIVARIQRDEFSKTLGEVREILCDALPNENQLTSFMAAKLVQERDEWKAKYIQQNKDLGCELMDPNGTIWDHAKKLQAELDAARKHS